MKKIYLIAALLVVSATASIAQSFEVGTKNVTLTTAFVSGYNIPIAISYEQGIHDFGGDHKLGLGGYVETGGSYTFVAPECNYHYVGVPNVDLYGGVRLGYRSINNRGGMHSTFSVGANYYFDPSWAINAEIGSGLGWLNVGATYRF